MATHFSQMARFLVTNLWLSSVSRKMAIDSGPGVGVVQKLLDKVYVLYSNET
jgi:hypothetical protein